MEQLKFKWDPIKEIVNRSKHGITFEEAKTVFCDEMAIIIDDPEHSELEERFIILGQSNYAQLLVVCHCYRESDSIIRIISARKATKNECMQYYHV